MILVVLGLLPIMGRLIAAIPVPVLGGAGLVLLEQSLQAGFVPWLKLIITSKKILSLLRPLLQPA